MMRNGQLRALIWDYDGTLADTRQKNLLVTRKIVEQVAGRDAGEFPALQSLANYLAVTQTSANWREMYRTAFGLTEAQTDQAGWLWTEYQLQDATPAPFYAGVSDVLLRLDHLPHGIVSQNARSNIAKALHTHGLTDYFGCIIGFEEVALQRQKPAPDGLLQCIAHLTGGTSGNVVYIGDHETDVRCARNAQTALQQQGAALQVLSIGVGYGVGTAPAQWQWPPDYTAMTPQDLIPLVERLS